MRRAVVLLFALCALSLARTARADLTATLHPTADTSIWSDSQNADGAGTLLYVGRANNTSVRRLLVRFDLSGIPSGSTITGASMTMYMTKAATTTPASGTAYLYRLTQSWGEGTSVAGSGGGAAPTTGDATWSYRFYSSSGWSSAGGSYTATGSPWGYAGSGYLDAVLGSKTFTINTTDISNFVNGTYTNNGWIIILSEGTLKSARQFDSQESGTPPTLTVTYKYPQGHACSAASQCSTGYCTNSVCCNVSACSAAGECYNAGTCQSGSGTCSNPAKSSGTACSSDGNNCTLDQCNGSGTCSHPAGNSGAACPDDGNECTNDQCNGVSTACQHPAKSSGTACTADSNPCTLDQCNGSGSCTHPAGNNGTGCNDGDACTQTDTCSGGVCVGGNPIVCTASDECHVAGSCTAGVCSNPAAPFGTGCTADSNPCTADECNGSGSCIHPAGNAGAQCSAPSCACPGGACTATLASTCTGSSTSCPAASQVSCGGALCSGNVCAGGCSTDTDCSSGYFCLGGACTLKYGNGTVCGANHDNYCSSGHCVDNYCCNAACAGGTGDCQACNVAGKLGTCSPIPSGTLCRAAASGGCDADDYCNGSSTACADGKLASGTTCRGSAGTCDVVETCNGSTNNCPTDGFKSSSTSCRAASCTAGVQTDAASCPGNGAQCPAVVTHNCAPYVCGATACKTSCSGDTDCSTGNWCDAGTCVAKYDNGVACAATNSCKSNFCVDGVCCNKACGGQCEACDVQGSGGTCTPVSGQPHDVGGSRSACAGDGSVCDGACNGSLTTACTYPGTGTSCRAASCTSGVATVGATCQGTGSCPAKQTVTCTPFVCGATACLGNCAGDVDCIVGDYCAGGVCKPLLDNGKACGANHECNSQYCVDGVCCDSACKGQCEACDVSGSEGVCSAVGGAPHGPRPACVGDNSTCDGTCDGQNRSSCDYPGTGTVCRQASCTSGTATLIAFCNGTGVCPPLQQQDCAPYTCGATGCAGECQVDADCGVSEFCSAGICKPQLDNGQGCADGSQCKSSLCVDGVCCNLSCTGQCEACDVPGNVGSCTAVTGAPEGVRAPCASDGSACGGTCDGVARAGCSYPGAATQCRAASCTSNVAVLGASCDGTGSCPAALAVSCTPKTCSGTKCGGGCSVDGDCTGSQFCAGGVCTTKIVQGAPCDRDAECGSGHCADGFCCNTACTGQCEACDVPPTLGACTTLKSGQPHGGRAACPGTGLCVGTCDGSSATSCTLPGAATTCGVAACAGGVVVSSAACNGAGVCLPPAFTNCAPYACSGTSCLTSCTTAADCALGYDCVGGACVQGSTADAGGAGAAGAAGMAGATGIDAGPDAGVDGSAGSAPDASPDSSAGSGGSAGTGGNSGTGATGGTGATSGSGGTGGSSVDAGPDAGAGGKSGNAADSGSCGCRTPGRGAPGGALELFALFGAVAIASRRRRRRSDARA